MKFERIGNIAKFINGAPFKPSDWGVEGLKIIRIQNLTDPSKPYNRSLKEVDEKYYVQSGDVLVSWSATIDVFIWNEEKALLNQHIFKVKFDESKVNKSFFIYALKDTINDLSRMAHGSTMKHVVKGDFENHKIPLPPLHTQLHIAKILSQAEGLIAQRRESIRLLDEYLKSVFLEMFGDPVRNEKGWERYELGNIAKIQGGLQVTTKRANYPIELSYLRVANVYRDRLKLDEIKTIRVTSSEADRVCLKKGDILVVEGHGNPNEIGRCAVWNGEIKRCLHQNHLIRVRVDAKLCLPIFISFYVNSPSGRRQMLKAGKTTSGLNTISSKNVKETLVLIPPLPLQTQFAQIVEKTEALKAQYQQSLHELENLYGSLSQRAFRGELNPKDGEVKYLEGLYSGVAAEGEVKYNKTR